MPVYIDTPTNGWSHMIADSIEELHNFAKSIGIKKCWYQNKRGKNQPHYDVRESKYSEAINQGAIQITRKELLLKLKIK
jgi:hypothetical protein